MDPYILTGLEALAGLVTGMIFALGLLLNT